MNTKQIVGIVAVIIVAGGAWWFLGNAPSTPSTTPTSSVVGDQTQVADKTYVENKPYYTVRAVYPGGAPSIVEKALMDVIVQFKNESNLENLTPQDIEIQGLGENKKYALDITYKRYQGAQTTSYVFSIYQDTLGAHPNGFYRTFTFDKQGNELKLADLFKSGARYLDVLSAQSYTQVSAQLKEKTGSEPTPDMLDTARIGTSPTPESLQFFYVDGDTLGLLFPPYQVAAYAAGSFEVKIPLSNLQDILK